LSTSSIYIEELGVDIRKNVFAIIDRMWTSGMCWIWMWTSDSLYKQMSHGLCTSGLFLIVTDVY